MSVRAPTVALRSAIPAMPARLPRVTREAMEQPPEQRVVWSYVLTMLSVCLGFLLVNLILVGQVQHYVAQRHLYHQFRQSLAEGSLPLGQTDLAGVLTPLGTPVAEVSIPSLGIDEVVVEGSTSFQTMQGIGHRRDTPMPGQPGVSVLLGRAAAYGGVFRHLDQLQPGAKISVLTGQGTANYLVIGVRTAKSRLPVLGPDDGRLTLTTASGPAFAPTGVTRVDAQLTSTAVGRPAPVLGAAAISGSEEAMSGDRSHAFALTWLVELLVLVLGLAIWSWKRWRKASTWVVFVPVIGTLGLTAAGSVCGMLPNLL